MGSKKKASEVFHPHTILRWLLIRWRTGSVMRHRRSLNRIQLGWFVEVDGVLGKVVGRDGSGLRIQYVDLNKRRLVAGGYFTTTSPTAVVIGIKRDAAQ